MDRLCDLQFFFNAEDDTVLALLKDTFAWELEHLKNAYSIRDSTSTRPSTQSPSQYLYGDDYDEVNRTLVSILALRWIYNGKYDVFVATQPDHILLSLDTFERIRKRVGEAIAGPDDLLILITSVIINDLGKDSGVASEYQARTGDDISDLNHDAILLKAVQASMVPSVNRLEARHRQDLLIGLEIGAEFNYGQLAQAESPPVCLKTLQRFAGHKRAVELHFVEQILDLAGAGGHMNWTCARRLVEPIMSAYFVADKVVMDILDGAVDVRDGYDEVLVLRAQILSQAGFKQLDVKSDSDRALLRILCMGDVSDSGIADIFHETWKSLELEERCTLIRTLNIDGSRGEPALQPTYMPALIRQAVDSYNTSIKKEDRGRALRSALCYLSRVMCVDEELDGAVIIERNVLDVVKNIVQSQKFREEPTILEAAAVPHAIVAARSVDD